MATWRVERLRYRLSAEGWDELLRRFEGVGRRGALVGDHGSGKTTLLEEWGERWAGIGFRVHRFRLTTEHASRAPKLDILTRDSGSRDIILLDGAEQLSWWQWRGFKEQTRHAHGVLVTTHRAGRWPTLIECRTRPELLAELVRELAPELALENRIPWVDLYRRHRGNLRDAIRELYDVLAGRPDHLNPMGD